jgi:hypothetical protein
MSDNKHDDGGCAFPWTLTSEGTTYDWVPGMTLLDWFAGKAVVLSFGQGLKHEAVARDAFDQAEALVAEKRKREGSK